MIGEARFRLANQKQDTELQNWDWRWLCVKNSKQIKRFEEKSRENKSAKSLFGSDKYFTNPAEFDKNISEPYSPGKLEPSNIL